MSVGFAVYPRVNKLSDDVLDLFKDVPASHISDSMNRIHGSDATLKRYHNGSKLIGRAITVKTRPGDNLMIHQAINMAAENDVLVVDADGDMTRAVFGEIMMLMSKNKGIKGLVVNGCIRDVGAFEEYDFPVYAMGITHKGPFKTGPGEVNVPVQVCGMHVNPGDLIVGDEDGVVSVKPDDIEIVLAKAKEKIRYEEQRIKSLLSGEKVKSVVNDNLLKEMGCKFYGKE